MYREREMYTYIYIYIYIHTYPVLSYVFTLHLYVLGLYNILGAPPPAPPRAPPAESKDRPPEFAKGCFSKGGFSNSCIIVAHNC